MDRPVRLSTLAAGAALGAAGCWLLDPVSGKRRRRLLRDRPAALVRRGRRRTMRVMRHGRAELHGFRQRTVHRVVHEQRDFDDATLADKVRSVLFRNGRIPKSRISVNAERGWIYLRGEVDSPDVVRLAGEHAAQIDGVRGVKNMLHTAHTYTGF